MPELIDRHALKNHLYRAQAEAFKRREWYVAGSIQSFIDILEKQPTIDAKPVRHGEWHESWYTDTVCASICTNCGKGATQARHIVGQELMTNVRYPLCPNCGADMREEGAGIGNG